MSDDYTDSPLHKRLVGLALLVFIAVLVLPEWIEIGPQTQDSDKTTVITVTKDETGHNPTLEPVVKATNQSAEPVVESPIEPVSEPVKTPPEVAPATNSSNLASSTPPPTPKVDTPPPNKPVAKKPSPAAPPKPVAKKTPPAVAPIALPPVRLVGRSQRSEPAQGWYIQVASFSERRRALAMKDRLKRYGFMAQLSTVIVQGNRRMRVKVGPYPTAKQFARANQRIKQITGIKNTLRIPADENR